MTKKENFIYAMEMLRKIVAAEKELTSAFELFGAMSMVDFFALKKAIVDLLADGMDDIDGWIEWFVEEAACGADLDAINSVLVNGKHFDISNEYKLYDFLREYNDKGKH